ncbi:hypothetical protein [Methylobacterium sp. V23]|uniref:hypothetical protein n=1 Tax=Methylobacterium sp. V23 TaxID=2044878 RepID=UPI0015E180AF|nr:hypothetical protein [Methylobacterium sp. V23]
MAEVDKAATALQERLSEVSRLATLLADRVLAAQAAAEPVPKEHVHALIDAAIILDRYEIDIPHSLSQIVDQIEDAEPAETQSMPEASQDDDAGRLAWLLRPFQGSKA